MLLLMNPGDGIESRDPHNDPMGGYVPATYLGEAPSLRWRDTSDGELIEISRTLVRFADGRELPVDSGWIRASSH
jgi:hypothetical protein